MDEIKLCLQVLDAGDSSESFPGNRLNLVLTEVSGGGGKQRWKVGTLDQASKKTTTNDKQDRKYLLCEHIQTYAHSQLQYKGREGGRVRDAGGGVTFMISGTIWF